MFGQGEVSDGDGFKAGDADGCDAEDQLTDPRIVELDDLGGLEAELDADGGQRGAKVTIFGLKLRFRSFVLFFFLAILFLAQCK